MMSSILVPRVRETAGSAAGGRARPIGRPRLKRRV